MQILQQIDLCGKIVTEDALPAQRRLSAQIMVAGTSMPGVSSDNYNYPLTTIRNAH